MREFGEENEEKTCLGLYSLKCQERKTCAIIIHLSPVSLSKADFFPHLPEQE